MSDPVMGPISGPPNLPPPDRPAFHAISGYPNAQALVPSALRFLKRTGLLPVSGHGTGDPGLLPSLAAGHRDRAEPNTRAHSNPGADCVRTHDDDSARG